MSTNLSQSAIYSTTKFRYKINLYTTLCMYIVLLALLFIFAVIIKIFYVKMNEMTNNVISVGNYTHLSAIKE